MEKDNLTPPPNDTFTQYFLDTETYFTMIYLIDWFTHLTKKYSIYCFTTYPIGLLILQNFPLTLAVQQNKFNVLI